MLIELYVGNYITLNDFVNGVDGNFKDYTETFSKSLIWIHFWNLQIGINTRFENHKCTKYSFGCWVHYISCTKVDSWSFNIWSIRCNKTWLYIHNDISYSFKRILIYLLFPISNKNFHVYSIVDQEMLHLKTTQYKLTIPNLKSYWKEFIIIQSFNTHSLNLHFGDILVDQNLLASHNFCLNETKIKNISTIKKFTIPY